MTQFVCPITNAMQTTQVAGGCKHLEEALALLQPQPHSHGGGGVSVSGAAGGHAVIAPDLVREIRSSLAELHSQCALEQVGSCSSPPPEGPLFNVQ
jgi:hypothetical protein